MAGVAVCAAAMDNIMGQFIRGLNASANSVARQ
jgi:hypothetical protein